MKKFFLGVAALLAFASCQNDNDDVFSEPQGEEKEIIDLGKVEEESDEEVLGVLSAKDIPSADGLKSGGSYYYDLKVVASNSSDVSSRTTSDGHYYSVWNIDLNEGAGGKYIYLLCCTTSDRNNALTYLRLDHDKTGWNTDRVVNGFSAVTNFDNHWVDLNEGAGGKYVYLSESKKYYSKPITNLLLVRNSDKITKKSRSYNGKTYYSVGDTEVGCGKDYPQLLSMVDLNLDTRPHKKYITLYYTRD